MSAFESLGLSTAQVTCFGLLLCRSGGWIICVPMLGAKGIATFVRVAIAAVIAFALTPVGMATGVHMPTSAAGFLVAGAGEFLLGATVGWVTGLLLQAAEMAGSLADATSGLSYASMVDPSSGNTQASFARLFSIVFLAIAFASDAHHQLIEGFASTVHTVPPGVWPVFSHGALTGVVDTVSALLRAAIEIGAPMLGALFLTEVSLGLLSKFYPQANILMIGLGVKALVAMTTAGLALMLIPPKLGPLLARGAETLAQVLG